MAAIEIPCANPDCDSQDILLRHSIETRLGVFEHRFDCQVCKTTFVIATELIVLSIPKEAE